MNIVATYRKRSFIMRSLYKDKSVILSFPLSLVIFVFICLHHSWNGVGYITSCCCIGLFVCLFVLSLLVIEKSLRMSVTIIFLKLSSQPDIYGPEEFSSQ